MTAQAGRLLVVDDDAGMCDMLEATLTKRGYEVTAANDEAGRLLGSARAGARRGRHRSSARRRERHRDLPAGRRASPRPTRDRDHRVRQAWTRPSRRCGPAPTTSSPSRSTSSSWPSPSNVPSSNHQLRTEVRLLRDRALHHGPRRRAHRSKRRDAPGLRPHRSESSGSDASILITGESGTGKELVARALHTRSGRTGRFVAVNCAAISAQLLESELFGHVQGAFTDARTDRDGLFLESNGGTLMLDEIGEMPLEMQSKLLRALQERKVRPVGSSQETEFDTRIIAATNTDIDEAVDSGGFREDLFYRINVVRIGMPPLRARGNDVLLLAQHFLEDLAERAGKDVVGITPDAAAKLLHYDWPGNVRELENVMERAVTLTRFDSITLEDLPDRVRGPREREPRRRLGRSRPPAHPRPARAPLHRPGPQGGGRQQDPGRPRARRRPPNALPQARALRERGRTSQGLSGGVRTLAPHRGVPPQGPARNR